MILADHFRWLDPSDAIFVSACRDALKLEPTAYKAVDAERRELRARLPEPAQSDPREGRSPSVEGFCP